MESDKNLKIFKDIGELCISGEFVEAQMSFFNKNCGIFTDDEENKLEYTNVYETYVKLIEQLIESQLKEKNGYSDQDLDEFYKSLKEDGAIKRYQETNNDTLEILYGFIDFDKFKLQMLKAQKGVQDKDSKETVEEYKENVNAKHSFSFEDFKKIESEDLSTWTRKLNEDKFTDGIKCTMY